MPFFEIVVPVFAILAVGYIANRILDFDIRTLSRMVLYILVPAAVVKSLSQTELALGEMGEIALVVLLLIFTMIALSSLISRALGFSRQMESAMVLTTAFMNAGNYGLPVNLFAFGQDGYDRAIIFMVVLSAANASLAVYYAARGRLGVKDAVRAVFQMPGVYAAALGLAMKYFGWSMPLPLAKPVSLLSQSAVPIFLLVLGMQLAKVRVQRAVGTVTLISFLRLIVSPLIAYLLTLATGLGGLSQKVVILEAAMPTAVTVTLLALEYEAEPDLVSTCTMATTLLSMFSLSLVLGALALL
ncbi:MAG: AEC family transporter [Bacillota bacterium]